MNDCISTVRTGPTCGAKTRAGGKCQRRPNSTGRCRLHGGASLRGVHSPTFKHGRRSKYIMGGKRLQKAYEAALNDPELTSLKHELAALDAILVDLVANMDGSDDQSAVVDLMEKRSRIAAREHRRMVQLDLMVGFDELLGRIGLMMEAVRKHVPDTVAVGLIATEWQRILGPLPRGITEGTGAVADRSRSGDDDGPQPEEADGGTDSDADLRNAFVAAMHRLSAESASEHG